MLSTRHHQTIGLSTATVLGAAVLFAGCDTKHDGQPQTAASSSNPVAAVPDPLQALVSEWHTALQNSGAPIKVDAAFIRVLEKRWQSSAVPPFSQSFSPAQMNCAVAYELIEQLDHFSSLLPAVDRMVVPIASRSGDGAGQSLSELAFADLQALLAAPETTARWKVLLNIENAPEWQPRCREFSSMYLSALLHRTRASQEHPQDINISLVGGILINPQSTPHLVMHQWISHDGVILDPSFTTDYGLTKLTENDPYFRCYVPLAECRISVTALPQGGYGRSKTLELRIRPNDIP